MAYLKVLLLLALAFPAWCGVLETETGRFLDETFGKPPAAETLWIIGDLPAAARRILGHDYPAARVRYWRVGQRSAWVLDEIGKEMPITVGISVDNGAVQHMRVLAYRESRGWEVKSPSFTAQFSGARLSAEHKLDRRIDGISGATLSVRALSRLVQLALLFDRHVNAGDKP